MTDFSDDLTAELADGHKCVVAERDNLWTAWRSAEEELSWWRERSYTSEERERLLRDALERIATDSREGWYLAAPELRAIACAALADSLGQSKEDDQIEEKMDYTPIQDIVGPRFPPEEDSEPDDPSEPSEEAV